jgi:hypothetical protein
MMRTLLSSAALATTLAIIFAGSALAADEWGTVKGRVTWGGDKPPKKEKIDVNKDGDHCLSKGDLYKEDVIVGKNGGVRYVFVWLQDVKDPSAALPIHPSLKEVKDKEVVMDQPCCMFTPPAVALREGQVLIGKNSSPIAHNMHWVGNDDNPGGNQLIPAGGKLEIKLVPSLKPVAVSCDIHGWMKAWVRIFDHPYFALTDADGKFEIKNAPAGKYNIVMWQGNVGWVNGDKMGQTIEIPAGKTIEVNQKLKPE